MAQVTMTYGEYSFSPVPIITYHEEKQRTGDGTPIGKNITVTLEGTLVAGMNGGNNGLPATDALFDELLAAFQTDGLKFEVMCDGELIMLGYPRVRPFDARPSQDNWTETIPYTIELEFDWISESAEEENPFEDAVTDINEQWSLEFVEDSSRYAWALEGGVTDVSPYQIRLTHSLSATGKRTYTSEGLAKQAWEQARSWTIKQLGLDSSQLSNNIFNLDASLFSVYNHIRSFQTDELAGSFSVTESWVAIDTATPGVAGSAIEDFTVNVRKSLEDDVTTVSIEGNIQGLEVRSYGAAPGSFAVTKTKDTSAEQYWAAIKSRLGPRANYVVSGMGLTRPLDLTKPVSTSIGRNPVSGTISYSYEYANRPTNCIPNALYEVIRISDVNPTDIFASLPVPGRANGPILQAINTKTSPTREVNIEVKMAPASGCPANAGQAAALIAASPKIAVRNLITQFELDLESSYSQVFKHVDTESWEPKSGQYNCTVGWTFQNC